MSVSDALTIGSVQAIVTVALLWLFRTFVAGAIDFHTKRVLAEHKAELEGLYADKLERVKSELRIFEHDTQAQLQLKQKQIDALYGTTMSARSGRQSAIDKRRLEAIERVWTSAIKMPGAATPKFLEPLHLENLFKATGVDLVKRKEFFGVIDVTTGATKILESKECVLLQEERPFLKPLVWSYYLAYNTLIMHSVLLVSLMGKGLFDDRYFDFQSIRAVVKKVLPHHEAGIDAHGITHCYMCSNELLEALLIALQQDLEGNEQDAAELQRSTEVMSAVAKVTSQIDKSVQLADKR